jgi:hypothetical protein
MKKKKDFKSIEINLPKRGKQKMRGHKIRCSTDWQRALKQRGVKKGFA